MVDNKYHLRLGVNGLAPAQKKSKRLSIREKSAIVDRVERLVVVALKILERLDPVTHLSIDGIFYFACHSELHLKLVADLRDEMELRWGVPRSDKYPLPWPNSQIAELLQSIAGDDSTELDKRGIAIAPGLLPGISLSGSDSYGLLMSMNPLANRIHCGVLNILAAVVWDFPIVDIRLVDSYLWFDHDERGYDEEVDGDESGPFPVDN